MSTLALLLKQPKQVKIGFVDALRSGDFQVDFLESEQHNWDIAITRHPVERGSKIVDHIQPQPRRCVISGVVTNTPLNLFDVVASEYNPFSTSKIVSLVNFLRDLQSSQKLVTLSTKYQTYPNMAVTNIGFSRDRTTGEKLPYTITFEEVTLVDSVVVPLASPARDGTGAPAAKGAGSATNDLGKKSTKVASPEAAASNGSIAYDNIVPGIKALSGGGG